MGVSGSKGWRAHSSMSTSIPSPGAVGTCQNPSIISSGPCTTSKYQGTAPTISSWITWFDVDTAKCSAATPAIGPSGSWGSDADPRGLGHGGDSGLHKPPQWHVGPRDADRAMTEEFIELGEVDQTLAGGDRNSRLRGDFAKPEGIAGRQHLLDEHRPPGLKGADIG